MKIRNAAVFLFAVSFLAGPHDEQSLGMIAIIFVLGQSVIIIGYTVDCIINFVRDKETSRQVRNYLWLVFPLAVQVFALGMSYSMVVSALWLTGIAVLLVLKAIQLGRGTGNSAKIVDGMFDLALHI